MVYIWSREGEVIYEFDEVESFDEVEKRVKEYLKYDYRWESFCEIVGECEEVSKEDLKEFEDLIEECYFGEYLDIIIEEYFEDCMGEYFGVVE